MLERFVGRLLCSLALLLLSSSVAVAADGNKEVFSPWSSAPSCVAGRACIYQLGSDKQLYGVDGNGVVTKLHGAKSFRTSTNCAGLSSPANGDVCFDTTLGYFRFYAGGWITVALAYSAPLSLSGQTLSIAASGLVYQRISAGAWGALGAATNYATHPGNAISAGEVVLSVVPRAGTAKKLYCYVATAPGGADTVLITVRKNAADQALTCTITGAATTCNDTSNTFAVAVADRLSMSIASSAGTAASLSCAFEVTN